MGSNGTAETNFAGRSSASRRMRIAAIAGGLAAIIGTASWWWTRPQASLRSMGRIGHLAEADSDEPQVTNPGYEGPQACAECHGERLTVMEGSRHFRTCRLPAPASMPPGFSPGYGAFATRDPRLRFEMTRAGDDFFQT